jgi:anthranilate phosphoribosyltransferase
VNGGAPPRRGSDGLDEAAAHALMDALLDDALPASDRNAVLQVYAARWPTSAETNGFCRSLADDTRVLAVPAERSRLVVLPARAVTPAQAAATALLALLLERYGVAALVVADTEASGALTSEVLSALGVETSPNAEYAEARLARRGIGCVALDLLAPRLARLLRTVRGHRSLLALAKLVDPFDGGAVRAIVADDDERAWLQRVTAATRGVVLLPPATDAPLTAAHIEQILAGARPVPPIALAHLGACLEGVRG